MVDEELLNPSRELLTKLRADIATLEIETKTRIDRHRKDDPDYAREIWHQFHKAIEPLRHEQERVLKTITDYYAAQPLPQMILSGQERAK